MERTKEMKEFNIIEAIEYLKKDCDADIFVKGKPHLKLKLTAYSNDYEVYIINNTTGNNRITNWASLFQSTFILQESEKPQRTHQEIMTNWFCRRDGNLWMKVMEYYDKKSEEKYFINEEWRTKEYFNDLEMSELPEE